MTTTKKKPKQTTDQKIKVLAKAIIEYGDHFQAALQVMESIVHRVIALEQAQPRQRKPK